MKTTSFFAACFVAAALLSSCRQDPQSAMGSNLPLNPPSTPAHPAIAYAGGSSLGVMDTNGSHATTIASSSSGTYSSPSWNYSGGSIAYAVTTSTSWKINATDVSVNSNGVPVGSNGRTIYSLTASDSTRVQSGPAWCATSSTGLVAFTRLHTDHANYGVTDLCTISQTGGTPTVLASYKRLSSSGTVLGLYSSPSWSLDDSKIAVIRNDTTLHCTILIFNTSTGAAEDSIPVSGAARNLEWSRTGTNELVYSVSTGGAYDLYYVAPSTGSTPSTNSVAGTCPTWSPNNSGIMYLGSQDKKVVPFTATTSNVGSGSFGNLNWKR